MTYVQPLMLLSYNFKNIFKMLFLHQMYNIKKMLVKRFFCFLENVILISFKHQEWTF